MSAEEISQTINLQEAIEKFINNVKDAFYPKKAFILIKKEAIGYISNNDSKINLPKIHPLYVLMKERQYPMQKGEIKSNQSKEAFEETMRWFDDNEIEVLIPLLLKEKPIGLLALGKKENLKSYTVTDLNLLLRWKRFVRCWVWTICNSLSSFEK